MSATTWAAAQEADPQQGAEDIDAASPDDESDLAFTCLKNVSKSARSPAFTVACVWTTSPLLPGYSLDGSVIQQFITAALVAVLYVAVPRSAAFFVHQSSGSGG